MTPGIGEASPVSYDNITRTRLELGHQPHLLTNGRAVQLRLPGVANPGQSPASPSRMRAALARGTHDPPELRHSSSDQNFLLLHPSPPGCRRIDSQNRPATTSLSNSENLSNSSSGISSHASQPQDGNPSVTQRPTLTSRAGKSVNAIVMGAQDS